MIEAAKDGTLATQIITTAVTAAQENNMGRAFPT